MRSQLVQILQSDDETDAGPSTDPVVRRFWGAATAPAPRLATSRARGDVIDLRRWIAARASRRP